MDKYGLIGYPLTHSFSAKFFNNKFKRESIDAEYNNYEIEDASLIKDIVSENLNLKGINVTIPHKESIIAFLDELYEDAEKIGAVNTIKVVYDNNSESILLQKGENLEDKAKAFFQMMYLDLGER